MNNIVANPDMLTVNPIMTVSSNITVNLKLNAYYILPRS
jgi:hypothetical protein